MKRNAEKKNVLRYKLFSKSGRMGGEGASDVLNMFPLADEIHFVFLLPRKDTIWKQCIH